MNQRYLSSNKDFTKNYNEESDIFLNLMFNMLKNYKLPFSPERRKIKKVGKFVANMHDKAEYVIHIRDLKQTLNLTLILEKVHRVIRFNQNAWLKPYIDTNTDLRKKQKMILKKILLSWWIMQFLEKLWKMWENMEILIKLVTTERRRNYFVSEPNYHTTKFFTENLLGIEMIKILKYEIDKYLWKH